MADKDLPSMWTDHLLKTLGEPFGNGFWSIKDFVAAGIMAQNRVGPKLALEDAEKMLRQQIDKALKA